MEIHQKCVQFHVSAGPEVHVHVRVRVCVEHMSAARPLNASL